MSKELVYKRKLCQRKNGSFILCIPPQVAAMLGAGFVGLIVGERGLEVRAWPEEAHDGT